MAIGGICIPFSYYCSKIAGKFTQTFAAATKDALYPHRMAFHALLWQVAPSFAFHLRGQSATERREWLPHRAGGTKLCTPARGNTLDGIERASRHAGGGKTGRSIRSVFISISVKSVFISVNKYPKEAYSGREAVLIARVSD